MWKNILKGTAIIAVITALLAALGITLANQTLKGSFVDNLDDDDIM